MKQEKAADILASYLNGNISWYKQEILRLSREHRADFVYYVLSNHSEELAMNMAINIIKLFK